MKISATANVGRGASPLAPKTLNPAPLLEAGRYEGVHLSEDDRGVVEACVAGLSHEKPMVEIFHLVIDRLFDSGWDVYEILRFLYEDMEAGKAGILGAAVERAIDMDARFVHETLAVGGVQESVPSGHDAAFRSRVATLQPNQTVYALIENMLLNGIEGLPPLVVDEGRSVSPGAFLEWAKSDEIFSLIIGRFQQLLLVCGPEHVNDLIEYRPERYIASQFIRYGCLKVKEGGVDLDERAVYLIMDQVAGTMDFAQFREIIGSLVERSPETVTNDTFVRVVDVLEDRNRGKKNRQFDENAFSKRFRHHWAYVSNEFKKRGKIRERLLIGWSDGSEVAHADLSRLLPKDLVFPVRSVADGSFYHPKDITMVSDVGPVGTGMFKNVFDLARAKVKGQLAAASSVPKKKNGGAAVVEVQPHDTSQGLEDMALDVGVITRIVEEMNATFASMTSLVRYTDEERP